MRRFSDRHSLHTLSELNITPLLDLAFVLLIIFMITTPLIENSTDLVLPGGDVGGKPVDLAKVQTVSIHSDGHVTLNEKEVSMEVLEAELRSAQASDPDAPVLIRSHNEQSVQRFSEVLAAAKRAGAKRIGFVTTPKE